MNKTCKHCNKTFKTKDKRKQFCNSSCSASYNNKKRVKKQGSCLNCAKKIKLKNKFCSVSCQHDYYWNSKLNGLDVNDLSLTFKTVKTLKKYIVHVNGHVCSVCGVEEWMGEPVPLVLDHVNGNSDDNSYFNLRLVCGNCDMQLPTYKSKNMGKGRYYRRVRYLEGKSF